MNPSGFPRMMMRLKHKDIAINGKREQAAKSWPIKPTYKGWPVRIKTDRFVNWTWKRMLEKTVQIWKA